MLRSPFPVDARSLELFQCCLGLLVAWEALWFLWEGQGEALITDDGVLPLKTLRACDILPSQAAIWSLHAGTASTVVIRVLLVAQCALGVALAIGFHERAAALGCWALVSSVISRNPMASHSGDTLLRIELLLSTLLPSHPRRGCLHSLATIALLTQPALMYFFAGALKCSASWRTDYTAVYYALHVDMAVKSVAVQLRSYEPIMKAASILTPYLEQWAVLLLLCPLSALQERLAVCLTTLGLLESRLKWSSSSPF